MAETKCPYFANQTHLAELMRVVQSWLGTPYCHMGCNRGGVDCTKFVGLLLVDLGILSDIDRNVYYSTDWHIHGDREVMLSSLREHSLKYLCPGLAVSEMVSGPALEAGDLLCIAMHQRGLCNHCAIYLGDDQIVHCLEGRGVFIAQFCFSYASRVKKIFRLYEA